MPKINLARAIRLNLDNGQFLDLPAGENKVDKDVADHWYVKANMVGAEDAPPAPAPLNTRSRSAPPWPKS